MSPRSSTNGSGPRDTFAEERALMVERQLRARGITDERVLWAMGQVPRHEFVPPDLREAAYADASLPLKAGQSISQPWMVAYMTQALGLMGKERVLEIGTGSGYQAAVLSLLCEGVITLEYIESLADSAEERLSRLGFDNVRVIRADGGRGWPEEAPYAAVMVTAGAPGVPPPLRDQLADGGRLVIPLDADDHQQLHLLTRHGMQHNDQMLVDCRFVPFLGEYGHGV